MKIFYLAIVLALAGGASLQAQSADTKTTANVKDGVILGGYDPVSYFKSPKPVRGNPQISAKVDNVTYLFSSVANRDEFLKEPKTYQPAYEGWCATAVASGRKFAIDPESYKVTDGRLFLFYKGWRGDAKKDWVKAEPESIKKADSNWPTVRTTEE